jgi:phosphonate transport system permease protein
MGTIIHPKNGEDWASSFERARAELARAKRARNASFVLLLLFALGISFWAGEVRTSTLLEGIPNFFNYINDIAPELRHDHLLTDLGEWYWNLGHWLILLVDTVLIAFLGTFLGTVAAFLLSFPASRNLSPNGTVHFASRRLLEFARAVPELVYALVFVFSFGIGPLPGVLALAVHTTGALGKLFSEANENASLDTVEGVRSVGADWFQTMRFAVVPQVLPNFLSYSLLRFEINVRAASVIGFVGAGGIGQELMFVIRQFVYSDISALVLLIILTVVLMDISCERLRHRLIGREALL